MVAADSRSVAASLTQLSEEETMFQSSVRQFARVHVHDRITRFSRMLSRIAR